ncbi:MAG: hypothetical protein IJO86_00785 [Oscillospiraceae bacterium]|nr:hypothetical protein [Oscillospiraceae bacterium]
MSNISFSVVNERKGDDVDSKFEYLVDVIVSLKKDLEYILSQTELRLTALENSK